MTSDIGLKDYYPLINKFSLHLGIVEWFSSKYVILEVDDFSIGYPLNFVSQLRGYDFLSS